MEKRVLITGAGSYIGTSFENYAKSFYPNIITSTIDMVDGRWMDAYFGEYDSIFHVAGIAHADTGRITDEERKRYYSVNRDLAIETAKKAKNEGVKQFIFMSSIIIYGDSAPYGKKKIIRIDTDPEPTDFYGDSKWQADKGIRMLEDERFTTAIVRPPMIYGRGSKGNYPVLSKIAKKYPIFPDIENERSMLYIGNLCEFLCQLIMQNRGGIFFPQNAEYTRTSEMVGEISRVSGRAIRITKVLNPIVFIACRCPGKLGKMSNKAFGSIVYDQKMSIYEGINYQKVSRKDSVRLTEED